MRMLSNKNRFPGNRFIQKQQSMAADRNPNHKYIQQCPECRQIHETRRENDEYCNQCKDDKLTA